MAGPRRRHLRGHRPRLLDRVLVVRQLSGTETRVTIRDLVPEDLAWAEATLDREFGGRRQARLGSLVDALEGPGLIAVDGAERIGLVTWLVGGSDSSPDEAEIRVVVLDPRRRGRGIGAELLAAAERRLAALAVRRAWLLTTNDNMRALAFYQRHGWRLATLRPGAVDEARLSLKPTLPTVGEHGIPVHDEIVLTRDLGVDR